jgi:hypothetical protein
VKNEKRKVTSDPTVGTFGKSGLKCRPFGAKGFPRRTKGRFSGVKKLPHGAKGRPYGIKIRKNELFCGKI